MIIIYQQIIIISFPHFLMITFHNDVTKRMQNVFYIILIIRNEIPQIKADLPNTLGEV